MKKKIAIISVAVLAVWLGLTSRAGNQSAEPSRSVTQTGVASTNALSVVTAILKQIPAGDTILDIRFTSSRTVQVRVCGADPSQGCTQHFEKMGSEWKRGKLAHWHSEQSVPGYPPQGVGSP